jgi:hypothetical protein
MGPIFVFEETINLIIFYLEMCHALHKCHVLNNTWQIEAPFYCPPFQGNIKVNTLYMQGTAIPLQAWAGP